MRRTIFFASALLLCGILFPKPNFTQEKAASTEPKMTDEDIAKKNPVPPTGESLAEARKMFGYNCAMCHGKAGDGKGDGDPERDCHPGQPAADGELHVQL